MSAASDARYYRRRMARALALPMLALALAGCPPPPQVFDDRSIGVAAPVDIGTNHGEDEDPTVVRTKEGHFRVIWSSKRDGRVHLFTRTSDDGEAWTNEQAITGDADDDYYPALIQSRDGMLHLAWFRLDRRTARRDVWYARSSDGRIWTRPARISTAGMDWAPAIYEDGFGMLWIVWSSGRSGNRELYAVRSGDGGRTWSRVFRLTQSAEEDDFPFVLVRADGERVLAWTRYRAGSRQDAYYRDASAEVVTATSQDGLRWSIPVTRSPPDPDERHVDFLPCLFGDAAGERAFVAWTSSRTATRGEILVRDLSEPASPIRQLSNSPANDYGARLVPAALGPGAYLMVWTSGRTGATRVVARTLPLE